MMTTVWDSAAGGPVTAILRSAVSNDQFARMMREFLTHRILRRMARDFDLDPAEGVLRASLVASQVAGLIMARYILKVEPLASMPGDALAAVVGPTLERYLFDPLPAGIGNGQTLMNPPPPDDGDLG
jgi:hypothetical protein